MMTSPRDVWNIFRAATEPNRNMEIGFLQHCCGTSIGELYLCCVQRKFPRNVQNFGYKMMISHSFTIVLSKMLTEVLRWCEYARWCSVPIAGRTSSPERRSGMGLTSPNTTPGNGASLGILGILWGSLYANSPEICPESRRSGTISW